MGKMTRIRNQAVTDAKQRPGTQDRNGDEWNIFNRDEGGKGDSQHQVLVRMDDPSESKAVRTKVLPGANFCHAMLSIPFIPFIPVPNLLSASWRSAGEI